MHRTFHGVRRIAIARVQRVHPGSERIRKLTCAGNRGGLRRQRDVEYGFDVRRGSQRCRLDPLDFGAPDPSFERDRLP